MARPVDLEPFGQHPDDRALSVVLKVTERCNLACRYCYFFKGRDQTYREHPAAMRARVMADVVAFLREAIQRYALRRVYLNLHGGEPLLLKREAFSDFCALARAALGTLCELEIAVQTNAVLIDAAWIEVFCRHNVKVGVSFDGDEASHDRHRRNKKGAGSYAETRRGWEQLMAAAEQQRLARPGVLCVIDPSQSGGDLFDHFARQLGARSLNFLLPDLSYDDRPEETFIAGCGAFLRAVFDAWAALDPRRIEVRFISQAYRALLTDQDGAPTRLSPQDVARLLTVRSNGDLEPVDNVAPRCAARTRLQVRSASLADVLATETWAEMRAAAAQLPPRCEACAWRPVEAGRSIRDTPSGAASRIPPSIVPHWRPSMRTRRARSAPPAPRSTRWRDGLAAHGMSSTWR